MEIRLSACYGKEVYTSFVQGKEMTRPTREEFESHLDGCHICQQAVRTITKEIRDTTPKVVRITVLHGNEELGRVEVELTPHMLSRELDQLAGKCGFAEAVKALADLANLQVFPKPIDTSNMKLW